MADIISTEIPRDIRKYKTEVIGPLTLKQAALVGIAAVIDFAVYLHFKDVITLENCRNLVWAYIFIDIPILAFMMEPQGVSMEQFLKQFIRYNFLLPPKRKNTSVVRERKKYDIDKKEAKATAKKIAALIPSHPEYKSYR